MDMIESPIKRSSTLPDLYPAKLKHSPALKAVSKHIKLPTERPLKLKPLNSLIISKPTKPVLSVSNKATWDLRASYSMGDLKLGKCLGRGTQGRVVLATIKDKECAVKIMHKAEKKAGELEWNILSSSKSPFLISSYGKINDKDHMYLILELMEGGDLFHLIRKRKLNPTEISFICAEIVLALEHLHSLGVVYRDLKPENVMIDSSGHIKLVDFGLSKVIGDERACTTCGSPEYMAPEVIRKQAYSYSADWWSFGILVYELFHGYTPFKGETSAETYENILEGEISFSRVDIVAENFIRSLLNPDPKLRLGHSESDIFRIKRHSFFRKIDWAATQEKSQSLLNKNH
ncbi:unnamed protein product [Blepharisma stoltei]|uniref:Protein kinase domain-containing protein n=1 Tax=Blepharisma stoltei TaxID=1481888 RepID=A0AAU9JC81_9CILI|nr:unnamed protein product [Blepharisma stoltei]